MAIETNQVVALEYEVRHGDSIVDSNVGQDPLVFIFGKGQIIPGLESGIASMAIGEQGDVLVKATDAYGDYNPEALEELPREQFAGIELQEGMSLYGQSADGQTVQVIVKEIGEQSVVIDYNHPLAGKDLMFSVKIHNVRDASADEVLSGVPAENQVESSCCGGGGGQSSCGCH